MKWLNNKMLAAGLLPAMMLCSLSVSAKKEKKQKEQEQPVEQVEQAEPVAEEVSETVAVEEVTDDELPQSPCCKIDSLEKEIAQLKASLPDNNRNLLRVANGYLYSQYDASLIEGALKDFEYLKANGNKEVLDRVAGMEPLLTNYATYRNDLMQIFKNAQADPTRTKDASNEAYRAKYLKELKSMPYYQQYYAKRNGNWSIPYLNSIIEAAEAMLQAHSVSGRTPASFIALIKLL